MVLESQCCLPAERESRTFSGTRGAQHVYFQMTHSECRVQYSRTIYAASVFIGARKTIGMSCPALPPAAVSDLNAVVCLLTLAACHVNTTLSSAAHSPFPPSLAHTQIMLFTLCQSLPPMPDSLSIRSHLSDVLEWRPEEPVPSFPPDPLAQSVRICFFVFFFLIVPFEASSLKVRTLTLHHLPFPVCLSAPGRAAHKCLRRQVHRHVALTKLGVHV